MRRGEDVLDVRRLADPELAGALAAGGLSLTGSSRRGLVILLGSGDPSPRTPFDSWPGRRDAWHGKAGDARS